MRLSSVFVPVAVTAFAVAGGLITSDRPSVEAAEGQKVLSFVAIDSNPDSVAGPDTVSPSIVGPSLTYGIDTSVSPCLDFYQHVNGGWRNQAVMPAKKSKHQTAQMVSLFSETNRLMRIRVKALVDSSKSIAATTTDPTMKVIGTFYQACMVADSMEKSPFKRKPSDPPVKDSTRDEMCQSRTLQHLGGAVGQAFVADLRSNGSVERMEKLLEALRAEVVNRIKANTLMTPTDKEVALERLAKLHLRVGIPDKLDDYSGLVLSPTDYHGNKTTIANFNNLQWVNSIGGNSREKWKASLLMVNAFYMPGDHAIEIPTIMFSPPFFYPEGEDALNYAGVGYIIGHEIFHSVAQQLPKIEHPDMKAAIDSFKEFNSSLGTLDGWGTNGKRTFGEDVADLGGSKVAYSAWKTVTKADKNYKDQVIDGLTPDQRFFLAMGRVWRGKWEGAAPNGDVHAAHFARVNAVSMQSEEFAKAFGCKAGDKMYMTPDKRSKIW